MRTLGKVVLAIVAAVVVLVVAFVVVIQTGAASNRVKDLVIPRVSAALGRDVTVKDARLHLFPPRVALEGTTIAGRAGEPPRYVPSPCWRTSARSSSASASLRRCSCSPSAG